MYPQNKNTAFKSHFGKEDGTWEIVYSGFVLILLCFFIMLCSFSSVEEGKVARFARSFANTVCILPGGIKADPSKLIIPPSPDIVSVKSEMGKILQSLKAVARESGVENDVSFSNKKNGLVMRLSDTILFDLGQAQVSAKGLHFLKKLASFFKKTSHSICIEGHTDNLPIHTKKYPSNWELSTARAVNVLRYFLKDGEISPDRLSAAGFSEFQPLFPNDTPDHRAKNRRVEILLTCPRTVSPVNRKAP